MAVLPEASCAVITGWVVNAVPAVAAKGSGLVVTASWVADPALTTMPVEVEVIPPLVAVKV